MSTLETLAVGGVALWLGVLTLVVVLLVRQVGLLTLRADQADAGPSLDGLSIGTMVPDVVLPVVADAPGLVHMLVLGADCGPCRELVNGVRDSDVDAHVIAVITGDPERASAVAEELPSTFQRVLPPTSDAVQLGLDLQTTPFLFAIDSNTIVDKSTLRGAEHFLQKIAPPPARDITTIEVTNA